MSVVRDTDRALALAGTVERLRAELAELRGEQRARAVVEQAKGLLAERFGCGVEAAHEHLLQVAADAGVEPAVAAALLLGAGEEPGDGGRVTRPTAAVFDPATYLTDPEPAPAPVLGPAPFTAPHLAAAAFDAARSPDELARRLAEGALDGLGAQAVVLTVLEPDGALRLAGAHGLPAHVVSEWARIPPHRNVGLVRAVREGAPLWRADPARLALLGAAARLDAPHSCVPLRAGGRIVGAAEITWAADAGPGDAAVARLRPVLAACARRLRELVPAAGDAAEAPWLRALLEVVHAPAALMSPVRDDAGRVVDFQVDAVAGDGDDLPGHRPAELAGARLLEHLPGLAVSGLFHAYVRVLETGAPLRRDPHDYTSFAGGRLVPTRLSVRACRVGGGVLVSWRFHDDQDDLAGQLAQAQRLGNLGWSRWDLVTGEVRWSDHLYRLFGRGPGDGPLPLAGLAGLVVPEDLPRAEHLMRTLLGRREPADVELRIRGGDGVRHLRVMAEPVLGPHGDPVALYTVFQDVTQRRRADRMLAATREQLREERRRIAEERHVAVQLQRAILPLPRGPRDLPGLRAAVRYLPASRQARVGGDWYEASPDPTGDGVFIAIGDVSGHGLAAAAAMATMRNALSGLACTGAAPDRLLGWLNTLLTSRHPSLTASAVVARYDPASRTLRWAQAGHPPPVLLRGDTAAVLAAPDGVVLGALDEPPLARAETVLEPGDTLLLYTDGLVERRDRDLDDGFDLLCRAAEQAAGAAPDALIEHVLRALGAANPDDDTCVLALRTV
ncbi:SpoIIE family protein phosphatase [Actinomadura parmotrematis]|uniref:SpoIIE family protein phosphatase n=1 Tax=Actinomadura parmotrematis TaxID=2864039 RepID=A0ABS7FSP6_9ACTN|nr:SpoIIE family protein phosphatase [Actinomadura parmotrematis]MBW8483424.1 SpoIIE family protein phosphatase [Actinomadura parmotrematis]